MSNSGGMTLTDDELESLYTVFNTRNSNIQVFKDILHRRRSEIVNAIMYNATSIDNINELRGSIIMLDSIIQIITHN